MSDEQATTLVLMAAAPLVILLFCLIWLAISDYRKARRTGTRWLY